MEEELIRVCAACKKVYINGTWKKIDLSARHQKQLTHGMCPVCICKYYPEYAPKVLEEQAIS